MSGAQPLTLDEQLDIGEPPALVPDANRPRNDTEEDSDTGRVHADPRKERQDKKRRKPRDDRGRHWFCTANNYTDDTIRIFLSLGAAAYAFQEEKGANGTPHLQGVFSFSNARKWSQLNNKCKELVFWELARDVRKCRTYCLKEKTRNGRSWTKGYKYGVLKVKDPLSGNVPYKWQLEVLNMVQLPPHDREIYWYWSTKGRVGKSALAKHLVMKEDAIFVGGKFSDAFYAIKARVDAKKEVYIVIFDLARSMGSKISYISIEGIKNGLIFNAKYESGMCLFNTPHILVFANQEPDYSQLSPDRWKVLCIDADDWLTIDDKEDKIA